MRDIAKAALEAARAAQFEAFSASAGVPDEGFLSHSQQVLPRSLFKNTRGYLEKIVNQINGCYEQGWFDACAVMIRRLLETLIVECFEHHGASAKIQSVNGDFFSLRDLIVKTTDENTWNLSRNTKQSLPKLKDIGDKSAHSRRFTARRWDIDRILEELRGVSEELLFLSGLR